MVNQRFCLIVLITIVFCVLFSIIVFAKDDNVKTTTCRLASQILGNNQRVCVFVGANNTQYREYVPYDAGECPRQYQCPYRPNEKPFDIKSVVRSIKEQFK
tara:strand:- start:218 stop:520 length:303 start_codon:yes stop_codon:yes gene_type:complete